MTSRGHFQRFCLHRERDLPQQARFSHLWVRAARVHHASSFVGLLVSMEVSFKP